MNDNIENSSLSLSTREFTSRATKRGLLEAKARGIKLGGFRENAFGDNKDGHAGREAIVAKANAYALRIAPILLDFKAEGLSLKAIADLLNSNGVKTIRGGRWQAVTVKRILERVKN